MPFDALLPPDALARAGALAQAAEAVGIAGLWMSETSHDPFLPLALAAQATQRIRLGTAVAIAFARSPLVLAQAAWDLAALSQGRFILGLGTQVKPHIERRFGMAWEPPAPKLRETVLALRDLWACWQHGQRLNFRGQFYKLTLMPPFFNPGPIPWPDIPIYIAGVNPALCRLAGESCQGFHVHPFHSARYVTEVIQPALAAGLHAAGRERAAIALSSAVLVAGGETEADAWQHVGAVRAQIAFYASTPSYRAVMALHGWGDTADRLGHLAARQRWDDMAGLITDDMVNTFATVAAWDDLPRRLTQRYAGLLDRLSLYTPFAGHDLDRWHALARALTSSF